MRIALATCSNLPDWEVDDEPLFDAFAQRGVEIVRPAWDDPAFDWGGCDACLIRTTWDYMERRDEYVAWAQRVGETTKLFNSQEVVRWNTHKTYLRDLESRGVAILPSVWIDVGSRIDLRETMARMGWTKGFLKPVIGATARETLRFDTTDSGYDHARRHLERLLVTEAMILQPYVSSVETEGELSVIMIDGKPSHAIRKIPVPGDYRVQDDFGASDEPVALTKPLCDLALDIMSKVEFDWLYARTDFLTDDAGQLRLTELEMVEPSMFFRHHRQAADTLADALLRRLES